MTVQEIEQTETLRVETANDTTSTDADESQPIQQTETAESDATIEETPQTPDSSKEEESDDDDDGIKRIRKLNSENKSLRTRLREAEDALKQLGTDSEAFKALVAEKDQFKNDYETLVSSLRTERLESLMTEASRKAGAIEPSAVIALASASDVKVEFNADNKPTNVDDVVKSLKAKFPKLFSGTHSNGNAGSRHERAADLDSLTPQQRIAAGLQQN